MQPRDTSRPAAKASTARYVMVVLVLMAIVAGLAWVMQYLPGRGPKTNQNPRAVEKKLLAFPRPIVRWYQQAEPGKPADTAKGGDELSKEEILPKDVEFGAKGFNDFLFKNVAGQDVEILFYRTPCSSCTMVQVGVMPQAAWDAFDKSQAERPTEPLPRTQEPSWTELPLDPQYTGKPLEKVALVVKRDEVGAVRVEWHANKGAGAILPVAPAIFFRAAGETTNSKQPLQVPILVQHPIQFEPQRINFGNLTAGKSSTAQFLAWSTTRKSLDFKLETSEPLFVVESTPLTGTELAAQQVAIASTKFSKDGDAKQKEAILKQLAPTIQCVYRVTVAVHESKDGKRIEQGSFFRRWPFLIDGRISDPPLYGPEITGRVLGDITVGGADDHGKIRFKSFKKDAGASHEVQLATEGNMVLDTVDRHPNQPKWIQVKLTRQRTEGARTTWLLEVTVPPNAHGATSFVEPDAVVLRIVGSDRIVRIPIEGHISQ